MVRTSMEISPCLITSGFSNFLKGFFVQRPVPHSQSYKIILSFDTYIPTQAPRDVSPARQKKAAPNILRALNFSYSLVHSKLVLPCLPTSRVCTSKCATNSCSECDSQLRQWVLRYETLEPLYFHSFVANSARPR